MLQFRIRIHQTMQTIWKNCTLAIQNSSSKTIESHFFPISIQMDLFVFVTLAHSGDFISMNWPQKVTWQTKIEISKRDRIHLTIIYSLCTMRLFCSKSWNINNRTQKTERVNKQLKLMTDFKRNGDKERTHTHTNAFSIDKIVSVAHIWLVRSKRRD